MSPERSNEDSNKILAKRLKEVEDKVFHHDNKDVDYDILTNQANE